MRAPRVIRASRLRILADVWNGEGGEGKAFRVGKGSLTPRALEATHRGNSIQSMHVVKEVVIP